MTTTQTNRGQFLRNLQRSALLSKSDLREAMDRLAHVEKPRAIARALVGCGLLTKFQAELLLAGRSKGFFLGPYKILDQLGQGGMGRVYKARHQSMMRTVALKVVVPQLVKTRKAHRLFLREVRAAAQLNHVNIVTAYDANEMDGRHYLAMEFVDGPNLEQLVRRHGPLPVGMACEIIRQVAEGLQHAHARGMIHRDIKPANLLLQTAKTTQSFLVKILDFGLARLNDPGVQDTTGTIETQENVVMGTPDFLSPEQARDLHEADIRSDLYSLGCTFFFLLTGKVPFPGGPTLSKLIRHASKEPLPISELRQGVPSEVVAIVKQLMAKDPAARCQTPQELAALVAPHAVTDAPVWSDRQASGPVVHVEKRDKPVVRNGTTGHGAPGAETVATFPRGLSLTPISGFVGESNAAAIEPDGEGRRLRRKPLVCSIGVVVLMALTLITSFILLSK
jgi:serine/threonine protein kinase